MLLRPDRLEAQHLALGHQRQTMLQFLVVFVDLVFAFLVDLKEAFELQYRSRRAEDVVHAVLALGRDVDRGLIEKRRHHLATPRSDSRSAGRASSRLPARYFSTTSGV